jgi:glyoxylase-like metal-dependent hydrolase (beta-lactamase superfamily II)
MLSILLSSSSIMSIGILTSVYFALLRGPWPKKSNFTVDFDKVRQLADADTNDLPSCINYLVIADGELPSWGAVAGEFGEPHAIEFPSFQLVYDDKTAIIETPYNKRLFEKFPYGKNFYQANYDLMQQALLEADFIIATHEHWDHLGGVAQSAHFDQLLSKSIFTKKQINGPTIKDAEFPEYAFDQYTALDYDGYHRVAPGVVLIEAPGHSVGHQFVYVLLQNGTEFLFTGDVVWVTANFEKQKARPWLANKKRLENREQIAHQMKWIYDEFYMNDQQHITMLTTHDPEQHQRYKATGLLHEGFHITNGR